MKLRILVSAMMVGLLHSSAFAADVKPAPVSAAAPATTAGSTAFTSDKEKFSYAIGWDIGERLKKSGLEVNSANLAQGLKDSIAGSPALLTDAQRQEVVQKVQKEFMAKKEAELKQLAEKNKRDGEAYLAANKAKPDVKTTASGLQYKVIEAGSGAQPTDNDEVVVEYEGKLINGQVFDSSYKRGKPAVAKLTDVIAGWKEALKLMKVGAKWEVAIPANLAYGETGLMGSPIGPNETLLFTIKLNGINAANTAKPATPSK